MARLTLTGTLETLSKLAAVPHKQENLANLDYAIILASFWMEDLEMVVLHPDSERQDKINATQDHQVLRQAMEILVSFSNVVTSADDLSPLKEYMTDNNS